MDESSNALPCGTRLDELELRHVLGAGAFGIVYLAHDHVLDRDVAVKEYMPVMLAQRTGTIEIALRSQADHESFALGLRSFLNEARLLAAFDHPSLIKVHRFWEANGTAYMVMPVLAGQTLKQIRSGLSGPPTEAWLRGLLESLLGALERLHDEKVFHRDISPDNIVVEPDGRPVLLDFGAARRVLPDRSQVLTAILKPAFAPIEQYAESGPLRQGPWTDLYALGGTLYYMLFGRSPTPSTARAMVDDWKPLMSCAPSGYTPNFVHAVEWMLARMPEDRPQSVQDLRNFLGSSEGSVPAQSASLNEGLALEKEATAAPDGQSNTQRRLLLPFLLGGAAIIAAAASAVFNRPAPPQLGHGSRADPLRPGSSTPAATQPSTPSAGRRK